MRIATLAVVSAAVILSGCAQRGLFGRGGPDEFAVSRAQPLVVPPDFALVPPRPGDPTPASDGRSEAIRALFGGDAPRSDAERQLLSSADAASAAPGARSVAGDPDTVVVDKGATTQTILAVPEGDGQEASTSTPQ